jgi:hypothetical protein
MTILDNVVLVYHGLHGMTTATENARGTRPRHKPRKQNGPQGVGSTAHTTTSKKEIEGTRQDYGVTVSPTFMKKSR